MTVEARAPHKPEDLKAFAHVRDWVFDLDNTLYPEHSNLFDQIDQRMTHFVSELLELERDAARTIQKEYYHRYGTTLRGLMLEHDVDVDAFLEYVHDIDHTPIEPNPELASAIAMLPGRKFIYTNGSRGHAEAVAKRLGIAEHFGEIFDIVAADLEPKPAPAPYERFFKAHDINTDNAAMFEDLVKNLVVPKSHGMVTTLLVPRGTREVFHGEWEFEGKDDDPVDFVTDDLTVFLEEILDVI